MISMPIDLLLLEDYALLLILTKDTCINICCHTMYQLEKIENKIRIYEVINRTCLDINFNIFLSYLVI